jgi:NADH-quinone oxidoreductase subunit C
MSTKFSPPPLAEALPAGSFEAAPTRDGIPTIVVGAPQLSEVAKTLREHALLRFDVCLDVTAVDRFPRAPRFEVVYHLVSVELTFTLRMKVVLAGDVAELPTVSNVWPSANWQEREVWDLFGIEFRGHPNLDRLLTPEDWEGHPLRKDYPVQVKLPVRTYEPLQLTEEEFRTNVEVDRRHRPGS